VTRAAIMAAALVAWGCADGEGGAAPLHRRLELRPAPGAAPRGEPRSLAHFAVGEELDLWSVDAPSTGRFRAPDGRRVLWARASGPMTVARLVRDRPVDLSEVDQIWVWATFRGKGDLVAEAVRDRRVVGRSSTVFVPTMDRPGLVVLDVGADMRALGEVDALSLVSPAASRRSSRRLGVAEVRLMSVPSALRAPEPAGTGDLVTIGGEARRGVGVVADRPVVASASVPRGARLHFSYGQPWELSRPGAAPVLMVTLSGDGGAPDERRFAVDTEPARWREADVDLDRWEGRSVEVRFAVKDERGGGPAACVVAEASVGVAGDDPPTVLLVTSDTHRADHLGVAGAGRDVATPALDALAARGVRFTDCFAPTNVTNPSHIALMTGTHPRDTAILLNNVRLADAAPTLAERYAEAGWVTAAVVSSSHLGHEVSGLGQGFDRMSWPTILPRDAEATVDLALDWLGELEGRPTFLWVHLFDAHTPYAPPEPFDGCYWDGDADPFDPSLPAPGTPDPIGMPGLRDLGFARAQYGGEITYLDHELGRLLDERRVAAGVVAVVADHGEGLGEHVMYFDHAELYPDTVHVPLILAWPGAPAGATVDGPVTHLDLGRTLLDLSGLEEASFPGRDFVDRADGDGAVRYLLASDARSASVQFGDLYLILHLRAHHAASAVRGYEHHQVELYDLATDRECKRDLVDERPGVAADLRRRLVRWLRDAPGEGWSSPVAEDPELLDQLRALGYAGTVSEPGQVLWEPDDCDRCRRWEASDR